MCGRYASTKTRDELTRDFLTDIVEGEDRGTQYNVAPTTGVYAVLERTHDDTRERQLRTLRWGLVPSWAKDTKIGNRLINARIETIADKPSWRTAYRKRRAILPAAGYYEWVTENDDAGKPVKQPYYLHPASGHDLCFAGLYELWPDPSKDEDDADRWLWSAAIITCAATGPAGEVHDRTPVILPRDRVDAWLDPDRTEPKGIAEVLEGIEPPLLGLRRVSRKVNKVGTNGPDLIAPLPESPQDRELQLQLVS